MYFILNMGIFHCYVNLPEIIFKLQMVHVHTWHLAPSPTRKTFRSTELLETLKTWPRSEKNYLKRPPRNPWVIHPSQNKKRTTHIYKKQSGFTIFPKFSLMIWLNHLVKPKKHRIPKAKKKHQENPRRVWWLPRPQAGNLQWHRHDLRPAIGWGGWWKGCWGKRYWKHGSECKLGVLLMIHIVISSL